MAKQEKLDWDYEEYFDEIFETTGVVMWNTHIPSFTFAFFLNELYQLKLQRQECVSLKKKKATTKCIVYSYVDAVMHTTYFFIENGQSTPGAERANAYFDKVLLVMGPNGHETSRRIQHDLEPPSLFGNEDKSPEIKCFVDSGILESAYFDYSDAEYPQTSYFPQTNVNEALKKKQSLFLKEQKDYLSDLILAVDHLIPNFDVV